jgi:hypothetical protein
MAQDATATNMSNITPADGMAGQSSAAKNPTVDEPTRAELAKDGVMQDGPSGVFFRNGKPLNRPDGSAKTVGEVQADLAKEKQGNAGAPVPDGNTAPPASADQESPIPDGASQPH